MMTPTLLTAWQLGRSFDAWDIEQIIPCVRSNLCFNCSVFTLWPAVAVAKNFYPIYIYIYTNDNISIGNCNCGPWDKSEETRLESSNAVAVKYLTPSSTAGRKKDMGIAEPHSETSCTGDAWNLPWSEPSCGVETNGVAGWKLLSLNPSQFSQTCFPIFQIKSYQIPKVIPWSYHDYAC